MAKAARIKVSEDDRHSYYNYNGKLKHNFFLLNCKVYYSYPRKSFFGYVNQIKFQDCMKMDLIQKQWFN